jgi:ribosomal protein L40E
MTPEWPIDSDDDVPVEAYRARNFYEAHELRDLLEMEGIDGFVDNETVNWLAWSLPAGWLTAVTIMVRRRDRERAREILVAAEAGLKRTPPEEVEKYTNERPACLSCGAALPEDQARCPSCGWSYEEDRDIPPEG